MDAQIAHKTADPYVELHYGKGGCCFNCCNCWNCCFDYHGWYKTKVCKDTLNPVWNEWFTFRDIEETDLPLIIKVKDYDKITRNDTIMSKEIIKKYPQEDVLDFTLTEKVKSNVVKLYMKANLTKRDQPPQDGNGQSDKR